MNGEPVPVTWPDGQPITPWADPWHDIAADIREAMAREAAAADMFPLPPWPWDQP